MTRTLLPTVLLALALLGCSSPPPAATAVQWSDFNVQANHDKHLSWEGYMRLPAAAMISDTMLIDLYQDKECKTKPLAVSMRIGSGKNQVEKPPKDYKLTDLKLHCDDGSLVGLDQKVRVQGKLIFSPSSSIFFGPTYVFKI